MAVIALDIGGTKIKGALLDTKFRMLKSLQVPTLASHSKEQILHSIELVISALKNNAKHKVSAIGISLPGIVDKDGKLLFAGVILSKLKGVAVASHFQKKFHLPVVVENDANCFALAEAFLSVGKQADTVLGVIWGSGVGAGLVQRDHKNKFKILPLPLEVGLNHVVHPSTGQIQTLESIAGGKYLEAMYKKKKGKLSHPHVGQIYRSKESFVKPFMDEAITAMGLTLAGLVNIIKPDVIVLGGGLAQLPTPVYTRLRTAIKNYAIPACAKKVKLKRFSIANDAGVYGAAILALHHT